MQVNNLPDLVNAAVNGEAFRLVTFSTDPMDADLTKACVTAAGICNGFEPVAVNRAIDAIVKHDPSVQFVLARELSMALYVCDSTLSINRLISLLRQAKPNELAPANFSSPFTFGTALVRAWWD